VPLLDPPWLQYSCISLVRCQSERESVLAGDCIDGNTKAATGTTVALVLLLQVPLAAATASVRPWVFDSVFF
jgi:hypothetical protein